MKTFLQKTKRILAICATLSGLAGVFAPAASAAQVSIDLSGTLFNGAQPFTATLTYDSETVFTARDSTTLMAGDYTGALNLGSITLTSGGESHSVSIYNITISQNVQSVGLENYSSVIAFYNPLYQFTISGVASDTPFTWASDLLPTPENPLPFDSPDVALRYYFKGTGISGISVDSYAVTAVPLPAAVWMFGTGLIGLGGLARQRRQ